MATHCVSDEKSNFDELLEIVGSVSIHHQNIRFLAIEIFEVFNGMNPQIVKEVYKFISLSVRKQIDFEVLSVHSVFSGTKSIKFLFLTMYMI